MNRVSPRTFYPVVCILLFTISSFANEVSSPGSNSSQNQHQLNFLSLVIAAPADLTIQTDLFSNTASNVLLGTPTFSVVPGISYAITNNAPLLFSIGTTKVIWTVSDNNGNIATAIQNVVVTDMEKPYVEHMGEMSVVNDPGKCGAVVSLITPYTYDNSGLPVSLINDAPAYFSVGSTLIIWTATDAYGNSDTSSQVITVIDNEIPVIKVSNINVMNDAGKCGAVVNLGIPETSDNCGVESVTNNAPDFFPVGTTLVTWIVTDKSGYTGSAVQTVMVADNEKPVMIAPANITVKNSSGKCGADSQVLIAPVVTDNCTVAGITSDAPVLLPKGITIVTWTATDVNGNSAIFAQSVLVVDGEAPVFSAVPVDVTVSCNAIPSVVNPLVTDNCDVSPILSFSQVSTKSANASLIGYYNYTITRTWVARDITGNTATAKQVITIADKSAPSLTVSANISVNNDLTKCGAVVKYAVATASDNCSSPVTITYSVSSGSLFPVGTTVVTVTAKDVSGNTTIKTFTVKVNDTQKPVITAPADIALNVVNPTSTITNLNLGTATTSDNCGVKSVNNNAPVSFAVGTTKVIWTVTDNSGNTSTSIQKVTLTALNSIIGGASAAKKVNVVLADKLNTGKQSSDNELVEEIKINVAPNPSSGYFTLLLQSKFDTPVTLKITDITGRVVEARSKLAANSTVQIGSNYMPGSYFAEMLQGTQHKVVQLIKIK